MMSTSDSCKDGASKSNDDGVCEVVNDMLQNMSTDDNDVSVCANCGKEGDDVNNTCNKCKQVKYCNAACKKKHRHKHKKDCEEHIRQAAKLAAELHDEKLFKEPPILNEDCPICFLRLPCKPLGSAYYACCGKILCYGCCYAPVYDNQGNKVHKKKCPFCRTSRPSTEENIIMYKKRVELDDPIAMYEVGSFYRDGSYGFAHDHKKALELYHRAGELGFTGVYCSIGYLYDNGFGVEVDKEKATHYYELAAMGGNVVARHNLGNNEKRAGNMDRALKHYMIAVNGGYTDSLKQIKRLYSFGFASKEDYTKALQSYQEYLGEIKSDQRDKAAAAREDFRYY